MANINTTEPSIGLGFLVQQLLGKHLTAQKSFDPASHEDIVTVHRHGRGGIIRESVVFPERSLVYAYGLPSNTKVVA